MLHLACRLLSLFRWLIGTVHLPGAIVAVMIAHLAIAQWHPGLLTWTLHALLDEDRGLILLRETLVCRSCPLHDIELTVAGAEIGTLAADWTSQVNMHHSHQ
jgi:hypothetical protein